ncbi:MAG: ABC transporter substrate-binding protein [Pseudomonadota bacterium]
MRKSHWLGATAIVLLATNPAWSADKVVFQLDWLPNGDKAAIYHGIELGIFEAADIEVEFSPGRGSSDAITKLATGVSDIGFGGLGALMTAEAEGDIPVKAIMPVYTKQPDAIFTTSDGPIQQITDLADKTIATAPFSSSNATWPLLLEVNEIDGSTIELLKAEPASLAPMLATGQVDGTINWVTVAPLAASVLEEAGKELLVIPWSEYGFDGYGLSLLASDKTIEERPDVLQRFTDAMKEAIKAANADPSAAATSLQKHVSETDVEVATAGYSASVPLIENEITDASGFGVFDADRLEETWKWVAESNGYAKDAIDPQALIANQFATN